MKNYLEPVFIKYESAFDKIVHRVDKGLNVLSNAPKYLLQNYNSIIEKIDEQIYDYLKKDTALARLIRKVSQPWIKVVLIGYKFFFQNHKSALIFRPGVHMVRAPVGGGKSLLSYILAEIYREKTGLGSYFTSPVEKPRITEDGKWKYVYHRYIKLDDYFDKDGKKIKIFNTRKHKVIHKDERHLAFNPRNNGKTEYNNSFQPQQQDEILMRHQGITHIYKYSQFMKLDSQDMQALTFMHDVETIKDIPFQKWLDDGLFNIIPVKLKVSTFVLDIDFDGRPKRKKVATYYLDIPYEKLKYYDTHAEKYRFANLPVDYA